MKHTRLLLASLLLSTSLFAQNSYHQIQKKIEIKTELLQKDLDIYRDSIRNDDMDKKRLYENKIHKDYTELMRLRKELESIS